MRTVRTSLRLLAVSLFLLALTGCSVFSRNPTRADMVIAATNANRSFTMAEHDLNVLFANGSLPASEHATLDPAVHSARAAVDSLERDALDPNFNAKNWHTALDAVTSAMVPILEVALQPKVAPSSPVKTPAILPKPKPATP